MESNWLLREILAELKSINKRLSALTLNLEKDAKIDISKLRLDEAIHDTLSEFEE